ncbi:MAG TPA: carbohydrate binding domain-containing protein [bacterium]|nr:carbohydrate binding domain-containing protein [bacterium]
MWHNLKDRIGRAEWDWSRKHSIFSKVVRSGERAVKLIWTPEEGIEWCQRWPVAISVRSGERYRCSGWIKTYKATGKTYMAAYTYQRDNEPVEMFRSKVLSGTNDWTRVEFDFQIPSSAEKLRIACRSDNNKGAAWFDDIEIIKLER